MPIGVAVMLGDVVAVEAEPVVGLDDLEPRFVIIRERQVGVAVEMIENAEFHDAPEDCSSVFRGGAYQIAAAMAVSGCTKEDPMPQVTITPRMAVSFSAYLSLPKNVERQGAGHRHDAADFRRQCRDARLHR